MQANTFGGTWTDSKLAVLEKYLRAYLSLMKGNERARHFKTKYIDAFAGSGYSLRRTKRDLVADSFSRDVDARGLIEGSAIRALKLATPFDSYFFIERSAEALSNLIGHIPDAVKLRVQLAHGDANSELAKLCAQWNTRSERAVVFLDPYGLQVKWNTLEKIARTQAMDLWMLFPIGMGVNRLLTTKGEPPAEWAATLDETFGTGDWRQAFYEKNVQAGLFGEVETTTKTAHFDGIAEFLLERLSTCFAHVCDRYLILRNSKNSPMFILLFAAAAPKGGAGVKIARDIIMKELAGP